MKQLFVEFPKGQGSATSGPHQTVIQILQKFSEWNSLKPVLGGINASMTRRDENQDGLISKYCISPDIVAAPVTFYIFWSSH
jgi:hypothetical protein